MAENFEGVKKAEVEINEIKYGLDNRNQTARRNNLVVSTKWSDTDLTNPQDQITAFAVECLSADTQELHITDCYRLGKRSLQGVTGSPSVQHGRPILVKFTAYNDKMRFVAAAKRIKTLFFVFFDEPFFVNYLHRCISSPLSVSLGFTRCFLSFLMNRSLSTSQSPSPVYLSDDLTPDRKEIFNDGRRCKSQKLITDVWTTNGRIGGILFFSSLSVWNSFVKTLSPSVTQSDAPSSVTN